MRVKIKAVYLLVPLHSVVCFPFFLRPLFFTILKTLQGAVAPYSPNWV